MSFFDASISKIEKLLNENSPESLTYAALECRLTIERICYERLRIAHKYISHDDLKRWQPAAIVRTLIQEVDAYAAETLTLSIHDKPLPNNSPEIDITKLNYVPVGTQMGFDPKQLGNLWNALSNLALHISLPDSADHVVNHLGDPPKVRRKVEEALGEIKRINQGNLIMSSFQPEISFECYCGQMNKRKLTLLDDKQTVNCINPQCEESYTYSSLDQSFERRKFDVQCKHCGEVHAIPVQAAKKLRYDQILKVKCSTCKKETMIFWKLAQDKPEHKISP